MFKSPRVGVLQKKIEESLEFVLIRHGVRRPRNGDIRTDVNHQKARDRKQPFRSSPHLQDSKPPNLLFNNCNLHSNSGRFSQPTNNSAFSSQKDASVCRARRPGARSSEDCRLRRGIQSRTSPWMKRHSSRRGQNTFGGDSSVARP